MKTIKIFGGLLVALLVITSVANAQSRYPYNQRQRLQYDRYNGGAHGSRLSYREAVKINRAKADLRRAHYMASRDGYVSPRERQYLRHKQTQLSKQIYRDKRDYNRW